MTSFQYNTAVPNAPNDPADDQPEMLINTVSTDGLIGVDHVTFNAPNGGYHTVIHQIKQASAPSPIANINQIFAMDYTPDTTAAVTDTQLFNITANGILSQLTGFDTSSATDGWASLSGIIIQWGKVVPVGSATSGTVSFKDRVPGAIPFTSNCFVVIANPLCLDNTGVTVPNSSGTVIIATTGLNATQFKWKFLSSSPLYTGFFWVAIGN